METKKERARERERSFAQEHACVSAFCVAAKNYISHSFLKAKTFSRGKVWKKRTNIKLRASLGWRSRTRMEEETGKKSWRIQKNKEMIEELVAKEK